MKYNNGMFKVDAEMYFSRGTTCKATVKHEPISTFIDCSVKTEGSMTERQCCGASSEPCTFWHICRGKCPNVEQGDLG